MGDRYDDRYGSYDDGYDDYATDRYGSGRASGSRRSSDSYAVYGSSAGSSGRRLSQSADARYDARENAVGSSHYDARGAGQAPGSSNLFSDYYSSDDIDSYRRSAYGSGQRRSTSPRRSPFDDVMPSRTSRRANHASPTPRVSSRDEQRRQADFDYEDDYDYEDEYGSEDIARGSAARSSYPRRASSARRDDAADRPYYARSRNARDYDDDYDDYDDYDDAPPAPKRSKLKRNLIIAAVVLVAVVLAGAGMAFAYINSISSNLHKGVDDDLKNALVKTDMANEPFYMLLLGVDTSEWRVENQADVADTVHSDSMMLARIDPVNKKATLISIDRDTMVDMGQYGEQKINAAYTLGGAAGAVKAVSKMTGLDISHYASVDFDGFAAIVDSLGGVEVDVPLAIDDPEAGGSVEAGLQTLNGEQALILCRSRHAYDDMDTVGGNIRDGYQRMVLSAIAKKVLSSDIPTIANTVREVSKYVTTDLEITDIIGLAQIMQGLDPATDIYTAREPTESLYINDTWYELLDKQEWAKMIARMDKGLPPSEKVEVDEATGVALATTGDAQAAAAAANSAASSGGERRAVNTRDPEEDEE